MLFVELARASERVAATRRRSEKLEALAACLSGVPEPEIEPAASFLAGELRQGRIGIGWASVSGTADLGAATEPTLTILDVDRAFTEIQDISGAGSTRKRAEILGRLLSRATEVEQSFLRRLLVGEIRQGALESLLLDAIAKAARVEPASVRRAQMVAADLGAVARAALTGGEAGLDRFGLSLFAPVKPMLAQTADTVADVFERYPRAAFELKLDGARVQVHKSGSTVRVYSRRLNEVTERVPEIVEAVAGLSAEDLILDGETIALAPDGAPLAFQETMKRFGRRLDIEPMRRQIPLRTFFFDVLRANGQTLIGETLERRIEALTEVMPEDLRIRRLLTANPAEASEFLKAALDEGHEGVMAKALESPYEAGDRGASWLKLKVAHTYDVVVLAAEWGSGRRQGWLSNLHLGARDEASGQFVMLGKTFKGLTDQMLEWQTRRLLELEARREGHVVFVRPELVVEIAFGDVQSSPHYPAGLALRFARVKRHRPDKQADQVEPLATFRTIHDAARRL